MLEDFMVETGNRAVTDHEEFNCARVLKVMIKDKPAASCIPGNNRRNQNDLHADLASFLVMCPNLHLVANHRLALPQQCLIQLNIAFGVQFHGKLFGGHPYSFAAAA